MGEIGAKGCTFSATRLERVKADSIWPLQKREGERLGRLPAGGRRVQAAAAEPDKGYCVVPVCFSRPSAVKTKEGPSPPKCRGAFIVVRIFFFCNYKKGAFAAFTFNNKSSCRQSKYKAGAVAAFMYPCMCHALLVSPIFITGQLLITLQM